MLEIIALIALSKRIGNTVQAKGLSPTRYKVLLVVLWFIGEIAGLMAFNALESGIRDGETLVLVLCAAAGASLGAVAAFTIANAAVPVLDDEDVRELQAMYG
jgi:hypothetical protein